MSTGSIVERIDYDERGNTLRDTNAGFIPFGFAGGIVDRDTGLIRFGARDYDPSVGRWTEKDAIGFNGGLNLYVYAGDDGVNRVDPSGHFWHIVAGAAAGAGIDLGWQLWNNGGNIDCVNWWQVGGAALVGAGVAAGLGEAFAVEAPELVEPWLSPPLTVTTTEDLTFFRAWGGESGEIGRWISGTVPESAEAAQSSLSLPPGNTAEFVSQVNLPAGTTLEVGQAAPAFGQSGGGIQYRIVGDLDPSWFGSANPL